MVGVMCVIVVCSMLCWWKVAIESELLHLDVFRANEEEFCDDQSTTAFKYVQLRLLL